MKNLKVGIIILNYLAYKETMECITSIRQQTYQNYRIVIVDNHSNNNSYLKLKEKYYDDKKISVIQASKNLGFAQGNNMGIELLKKEGVFNVLVINSDTVLIQQNYLEKLVKLDLDSSCAMVGTKILSADHYNQNVLKRGIKDELDIRNMKKHHEKVYWVTYFGLIHIPFLKKRLFKRINPEIYDEQTHLLNSREEMLHGAALFFTETYLKQYIGFYPDTFLYMEEDCLAEICLKLEMTQMYFADLEIFHKENASGNMAAKSNFRKSVLQKINFELKSADIFQKLLKSSKQSLKAKILIE